MEVKKYINDLLELTNSSTDNQKIKDLKHTINRYFDLFPTKVKKMVCSGVKKWLDDNLDISHQIYSEYYTEQQKSLTKLSYDILDTCFILNGRIIPTEPILAGPPSTSKPGDPPSSPKPRGPPPPPKPGDPPRIGGPPRPPGSEELPRPPLPPGGHPRPALVLPPKSDDPLPSPLSVSLPPSEVAVPTTVALELPEKYAKMKKMGVPQGGIIQKMKTDNVSQDDIDKYFPPAPVVTRTVDSDLLCKSFVNNWKFIKDNINNSKQPTPDEYKKFILEVFTKVSTNKLLKDIKQSDINECITKIKRENGSDPIKIPSITITPEEKASAIEKAKEAKASTGFVMTPDSLKEAMAKRKSSPKLIKIDPINETTCKEIIDWYAENYKKDDILELIKTYSNDKKIDIRSVEKCIKDILGLDSIKKYTDLHHMYKSNLDTKIRAWKKPADEGWDSS